MVTVLDEDLRAGEASVNSCHVQGALPFFTLETEKNKCFTCLADKSLFIPHILKQNVRVKVVVGMALVSLREGVQI